MTTLLHEEERETDVLYRLLNLRPWKEEERRWFDNEAVRKAIQGNPEAANFRYRFKTGRGYGCKIRPIFMACALRAKLDVVELLYNACPQALCDVDDDGCTPLHYACIYRAPLDVVSLIVEKFPPTLIRGDRWGQTPFRCACDFATPEVVALLVQCYPKAIQRVLEKTDCEGFGDPIERSFSFEKPVRSTALQYVMALKHMDTYGPPNSHRCFAPPFWDVVMLLLEEHPRSIEHKDQLGLTLLHRACKYGAPFHVVKILVESYPNALEARSGNGETPLEIVERKTHTSPEVMTLLTTLLTLHFLDPNAKEVKEMMIQSSGKSWRSHFAPILNFHVSVVLALDLNDGVIPLLLAKVGKECKLQTMFQIVREKVGLFEGVMRRKKRRLVSDCIRSDSKRRRRTRPTDEKPHPSNWPTPGHRGQNSASFGRARVDNQCHHVKKNAAFVGREQKVLFSGPGEDIELVISQVGCSRRQAVEALLANGGDVVKSIMSLTATVRVNQ